MSDDADAAPDNQLTPFLLEARGVRGAILRLTEGVSEMFGHRAYPPDVLTLLGEACAAAPLLASHLKFEGRINLQFQNGAKLPLLLAQVTDELQVRGMAKCAADAAGNFRELTADGLLALMLEPRRGQSYQAMVEVRGDRLAQALEGYFEQSEQLPTRLCLAAGPDSVAGLMLQRLPASDAGASAADDWTHLGALFDTLGPEELLANPPQTILQRLFHEEALRVFEPRPVALRCTCSHASISAMLLSLGEEELQPVLASHGQVEVTCEFCGRQYHYTPADVATLFRAREAEPGAGPLH
jgi:molecular chaperone Hsp33